MRISFDTETSTPRDVAALIVLLNTVSPGALEAALEQTGGVLTHERGPARVERIPDDAFAAFGDPDEATAAFGEPADPTAAFGAPDPLAGAPPAPPSAPAASVATVEVDREGYPWDGRIHALTAAGGGSINKGDGLWRAKKGVPVELVASVQAELRARGHVPPVTVGGETLPSVPPPPPPPSQATVAPPAEAPASPPATSESAPPAPAASPAPPVSSPAPSRPIDLFQALMKKVTPAQNNGLLTVMDITGMCQAVGIKQLGDLLTQPQHIPTIEAQVDALVSAASGA